MILIQVYVFVSIAGHRRKELYSWELYIILDLIWAIRQFLALIVNSPRLLFVVKPLADFRVKPELCRVS